MAKLSVKGLYQLDEALDDVDKHAKEELDGLDLDLNANPEAEDTEKDIEVDIEAPPEPTNGYTLQNVSDQLNGMIEKWFQLASEMPPEKKEKFLKLGDRLDEITNVIRSEFM